MVLPPILGATLLEVKDLLDPAVEDGAPRRPPSSSVLSPPS